MVGRTQKVKDGGRVVRKALVIAYGVHESGIREVIGLDVGHAETEPFWRSFLRSLVARGLTGVEVCVSDAHEGLKAAIAQVLGCPWQRCSVHFLRDALGHCPKDRQGMLAAAIRPIFNAETGEQARALLRETVERLESPLPKVAALLEAAENDLLAFYAFPASHWSKLRSTDENVKRAGRRAARFRGMDWSRRLLAGLRSAPVVSVRRRSALFRSCEAGRCATVGVTLRRGRG